MKYLIFLLLMTEINLSCVNRTTPKINGVSLVSPPKPITKESFSSLKTINPNWVSIIPYAFSRKNSPQVITEHPNQWWGEKRKGAITLIKYAKELGYNIMIKPHVWIQGEGWAGEYELFTEKDWKKWEKDYSDYILDYAKIADSLDVDLFCIGTEFRLASKKRSNFWKTLIWKIRQSYTLKLTYAANWDNYSNITWWESLDYIGIDAYFPLLNQKNPNTFSLLNTWDSIKIKIHAFSTQYQKPILFTEYGYQNIDYSTRLPWEERGSEVDENQILQKNAYLAIYQAFWKEDWFAGGFLWKWHLNFPPAHDRFTPQNKSVQKTIAEWYAKTHDL